MEYVRVYLVLRLDTRLETLYISVLEHIVLPSPSHKNVNVYARVPGMQSLVVAYLRIALPFRPLEP